VSKGADRFAWMGVIVYLLLMMVFVGVFGFFMTEVFHTPEPSEPIWLQRVLDTPVPTNLTSDQLAQWDKRLSTTAPEFGYPGQEKKLWFCSEQSAECLRRRTLQVLSTRAAVPDPVEQELTQIVRDYLLSDFTYP